MSSSSESEDDYLFLLIGTVLNKRIKRKKKPRFWIHFIISKRQNWGYFYTIYNEIIKDQEKFFNFTRMSRETFQELFSVIRKPCLKRDTAMRNSIPVEEKLLITLIFSEYAWHRISQISGLKCIQLISFSIFKFSIVTKTSWHHCK